VWIYPEKMSVVASNPIHDDPDPSSLEAFLPQKPKETSPFTSRRVVHECMTSESEPESDSTVLIFHLYHSVIDYYIEGYIEV